MRRAYPGASHAPLDEGTSVAGTAAQPEGITNPPIDRLLETVDSKYALVLYSSQRARQINAYYSQLSEGLLEFVGPLVDVENRSEERRVGKAWRSRGAEERERERWVGRRHTR